MTILRAIATIVGCAVLFAGIGVGIGYGLGELLFDTSKGVKLYRSTLKGIDFIFFKRRTKNVNEKRKFAQQIIRSRASFFGKNLLRKFFGRVAQG